MPEFSSSKIINHHFHVDNEKGESGIGYDMTIGCDLMVQLGLTADFKHQVLQWDGATVHLKESSSLLVQSDLTKRKMRKVVIQTGEPSSTQEATELMVKILDSTYVKADLKQVANNATHLNAEEITLLLRLLEDFEEFFNGNLCDWVTEPINLELNSDSNIFNSRYYPVPRINKKTFLKELKRLL